MTTTWSDFGEFKRNEKGEMVILDFDKYKKFEERRIKNGIY